jgi:hypothetical protein
MDLDVGCVKGLRICDSPHIDIKKSSNLSRTNQQQEACHQRLHQAEA